MDATSGCPYAEGFNSEAQQEALSSLTMPLCQVLDERGVCSCWAQCGEMARRRPQRAPAWPKTKTPFAEVYAAQRSRHLERR